MKNKKLTLLLMRTLIVACAIAMNACHTVLTAPPLFADGSNQAVEVAIGMYALISLPCIYLLLASKFLWSTND